MYYFILLIILIILTIVAIYCNKGDFLEPDALLLAMFSFATSVGLYLYNYWDLGNYGSQTVLIILLGLISFSIGSYIARHFRISFGSNRSDTFHSEIPLFSRINVSPTVHSFVTLISVLILVIFIQYFRRVASSSSIASMISLYKDIRTSDDANMPSYLNVLIKVSAGFAHIALFILLNNIVSKNRHISDLFFLVPVLSYSMICLLSANRGDILMLAIGGFVTGYILYCRKYGWSRKQSATVIRKGAKYGIILLVLFWAFLLYIGRDIHAGDRNIFKYLCSYISGSLASFDLYLKQGGVPTTKWGQETFVALNNNLYSIFKIGEPSQRYLEFRSTIAYSTTNIYSSFRRFHHDFGYGGVIWLSLLQGMITSAMYKKVKYNHKRATDVDFSLCFYGFFAYTIVYTLIDELFYSSNVSISGFVKVVILFVCYKVYFYQSNQEKMIP